jgi:alpha-D-ribose 1-methylphosphonate 5-triphosphate synthase subunit PhnH
MQSRPATTFGKGLEDPVLAAQRCFRRILSAMSEPGTILSLDEAVESPSGVPAAAMLVLLTLVDQETPVWLAPRFAAEAAPYLRFHCGAPIVEAPELAAFALVDGADPVLDVAAFDAGDERYPDRSATLIVACAALEGGRRVTLAGPGIRKEGVAAPSGLAAGFWEGLAANNARYPLGVDVILAAGNRIMSIPRSTHIALATEAL